MHIDPRRLSFLLAVQRMGGIVAAADELGISPSAVSQQIRKLEDEVEITVIEREPSGIVLTTAGKLLAGCAQRIENEIDDTLRILRPLTGQPTGLVRIGSFQTVLRAVLVPFFNVLKQDLPGIEIELLEVEEVRGRSMLRAGSIDLLMIERDEMEPHTPAAFIDTLLFDEPWVLVTSESTPPITSNADLANLTWLDTQRDTAGKRVLDRVTAQIPDPHISEHTYSNYGVALALVRSGIGSTVLPQLALMDAPLEGVRVTPLPQLGGRLLLVRQRKGDLGPSNPVMRVRESLSSWIRTHPPVVS